MFKRGIIFLAFLVLAGLAVSQGEQLRLYFFILYPLALFPVLSLLDRRDLFFFLSLVLLAVFYLIYFFRHPSPEMAWFGLLQAGILGAYVAYKFRWGRTLRAQTARVESARLELEGLKQKHQSRLESLHHLENQVAGLLDLFEIARDFSECLSLEGLVEILHKKVLPELPFQKMRLVLLDKSAENAPTPRHFLISTEGVQKFEESLSGEEIQEAEKIGQSREMVQKEGRWLFSLLAETHENPVMLSIEGADPNDLAKFEVLAAYLTLQVKKIRLYETVRERSIKDGLTGVFVRRHFLERFEEELKRSLKYKHPLAVLMLDIDHFKRYNDDYGNVAGDATLKQVAALLRDNLRKVDVVARYGGEEFVVVIPETHRDGALEVAERIRSSIARYHFKVFNEETQVTVSIGIAFLKEENLEALVSDSPADLASELIQKTDKALYRAKEEGRNRVILFQD